MLKLTVDRRKEIRDKSEEKTRVCDTVYIIKTDTIVEYVYSSKLIDAIIHVESKGNDSAVNHRSSAVGCMQIRPIMVREVNRICTKLDMDKKFRMDDRYSRKESINMFNIWKDFHHKGDPPEVVARCWNGGGDGYAKESTINYWTSVKERL
jgi:hypothetical protein